MSKTPPNWCIYDKSKKKKLEKSFQHQFPFLGKPSFYHPILDLYTSTNLHTKRLNHKYLALELGDTIKTINESCKIIKVNVEINKDRNISQWRRCFIKEIPLVPLRHSGLLENVKKTPFRNKISNFLIFKNLYSIENSAYVEQLTSFICSNLVENDISLHFPYYYEMLLEFLKNIHLVNLNHQIF